MDGWMDKGSAVEKSRQKDKNDKYKRRNLRLVLRTLRIPNNTLQLCADLRWN